MRRFIVYAAIIERVCGFAFVSYRYQNVLRSQEVYVKIHDGKVQTVETNATISNR